MPRSTSFPSGHSAAAFAFAAGAAMELPALAPVLAPLALAVGYSRVHTGVHYPSDVAAGAAIGIGSAALARRLGPHASPGAVASRRPARLARRGRRRPARHRSLVSARGSVERWVPGVRALRTYERAWLRPDLVAGIVLAAILVPQGMAYAELAGLPAVTGLYTTIACLVGYALFGPSRVLVLGPDSSISPLILAAVTPLLAGGGAATAIALAGMLAVLVGLTEIGLGLGKLGFVADLLSKEVQVGYMNGLAHHDHRGPAAEAVRLLDQRRLVPEGGQGLLRRPRPDRLHDAAGRPRRARAAAGAAAHHPAGAGRARRRWWRRPSPRPCSSSPATASTRSGRCPRGFPRPAFRGRTPATSGRC